MQLVRGVLEVGRLCATRPSCRRLPALRRVASSRSRTSGSPSTSSRARRGPAVARPAAPAQPGVRVRRVHRRAGRPRRSLHDECRPDLPGRRSPSPIRTGERSCSTGTRLTRSGQRSTGANYVLTTGTGSGKSLAYIVPIVDHVLRDAARGDGRIKAIVVYPMNALANSQEEELREVPAARLPGRAGGR